MLVKLVRHPTVNLEGKKTDSKVNPHHWTNHPLDLMNQEIASGFQDQGQRKDNSIVIKSPTARGTIFTLWLACWPAAKFSKPDSLISSH